MSNFTLLTSNEEIRCTLQYINSFYENQPESTTYFSDIIISDLCNIFLNQFHCDAKVTLQGRAFNCNFEKPKDARRNINKVIAGDTDNQVTNGVPCSSMFKKNCTASKIVLASGRYFKSLFKKPFTPIGKRNYTDMNNKTSQVDFVMQCGTYNYSNSNIINAQIVQYYLRYNFLLYTMIVPNEGNSLSDLTKTLQDTNKYNQAMDSLKPTSLKLILPKLSSATSVTNTVDVLKKEGIVPSYFNADTSNFVDETGTPRNSYQADGVSTVFVVNAADFDGNNDNECSNANAGMMDFVIDRPSIFFTSVRGVINYCGVSKVDTD